VADCVFCKIISGSLPSKRVYQDDLITAFEDIHPVAPTHILIVPNQHLDSLNEASEKDVSMLGRMFVVARELAKQMGIQDSGYRIAVNTGPHAGQVVYHLHMHLVGGQRMRYPIG
jgi:histidine triad (HIT) family protein